MATENEKGWNGLRQEAIREEMTELHGSLPAVSFLFPTGLLHSLQTR